MGKAVLQMAILAVILVVVYGVFRDYLPKECIAALLVVGVMAFSWLRRQITI
jgi:hypothetical protein